MERITRFALTAFVGAVLVMAMATASFASGHLSVDQRVAIAAKQGNAAKAALVKEAARTHNLALMRAIIKRAKVTTTYSTTASVSTMLDTIYPGCHYSSFSSKHSIAFGLTMGTQTITEFGFCWNGWKITWWGGHSAYRWAQWGYCWVNYGDNDYWNPYPAWRTAAAWGSLGANWPIVGCQSLQWDRPYINYANGGGIFRH